MKTSHLSTGLYLLMLVGCGDAATAPSSSPSPTPQSAEVASSEAALSNAFAACGEEAHACFAAAGSSAEFKSCQDQFRACTQDAIEEIKAKADVVRGCLADARSCAESAESFADYQACQQEFLDCVGFELPPPPPGAECVEGLCDCIKTGTNPLQCATEARECFGALRPTPGEPNTPG